jgi:hypothetical protein
VLQVRAAAVRGVPHVRASHVAGGALAHFGQPRHYVPVPEALPRFLSPRLCGTAALDCVYPRAAPVAGATGASAAGRRSTALGEARRIDVKTTSMRGVAQEPIRRGALAAGMVSCPVLPDGRTVRQDRDCDTTTDGAAKPDVLAQVEEKSKAGTGSDPLAITRLSQPALPSAC